MALSHRNPRAPCTTRGRSPNCRSRCWRPTMTLERTFQTRGGKTPHTGRNKGTTAPTQRNCHVGHSHPQGRSRRHATVRIPNHAMIMVSAPVKLLTVATRCHSLTPRCYESIRGCCFKHLMSNSPKQTTCWWIKCRCVHDVMEVSHLIFEGEHVRNNTTPCASTLRIC